MAMDTTEQGPQKLPMWTKRLGWLVLIWSLSVASLAVVAMLVKACMALAGFGR